jgi:WD40 repeat protein
MTAPSERARSGVRAWVRQTGRNLRSATPFAIVAALTASAIAPIAGASLGAGPEFAAALGQLGNIGGNYLADLLAGTAQRLRAQDLDEWRDAITTDLVAALEAGDLGLRDESATLLHAIGAVDAALQVAGDQQQEALAYAFAALGDDVSRLHILAVDAAASLTGLQAELAAQGRALAAQTGLLRQSLALLARLQLEVRPPDPARPAPQPPAAGASPYPGLAHFGTADAPHFYGRETLVGDLLARLTEQLAGGPPVIVVGVSGVGKSSLLHAGVLPAVAAGGLGPESGAWPWLLMTPGAHPLADLTERRAALAAPDERVLIVVDQFEELFTQCPDPAEREAFALALATAAPALVLIAVRADFYPQCTSLPALRPLLATGQVVAGPLSVADLRRAIHDPARDAGLTLEPGLEELLLTDLGALAGDGYPPGALPLLAHALRATWERRSGNTLTVEGYRAAGGIRHALAETAESVYLSLPPEGRDQLRGALLALVTLAGDLAVRRRAAPGEVNAPVLTPLIEARLVTAGSDGVEISHEALLTGWPRLAGWLDEAREEILLRQRLTLAADEWAGDPDALYRGSRLAAARDWAAGRTDLSDAQSRFLAAGVAAEDARLRDRQRGVRRLRALAAGLAVALLLAVSGGVVALVQRGNARDSTQVAESQAVALQARSELFTDSVSATRGALEAWALKHTPEARSALISAQQGAVLGPLGTESRAYTVAVSPDGRWVATAFYDGRIQLWDAAALTQIGPDLRSPAVGVLSLAFSPDGRYLASGAAARDGVIVWDLTTLAIKYRLRAAGSVTWRPDSTLVAMRAEGDAVLHEAGIWDPGTGRLAGSVPSAVDVGIALAVSRDGRYLAVTGPAAAEVIRFSDRRRVATLPKRSLAVAVAPDDSVVVGLPDGDSIGRWAVPSGRRLADLRDPAAPTLAGHLAITPDGTVYAPGVPGQIASLTLAGEARLALTGFPGTALAVDLSADGHLLAVVGLNAPPMLFRVGVDRLAVPQNVASVVSDPTGTRLATGSVDPVVRIWNPRSSTLLATLPLPGGGGPRGLAYAGDGSLAAGAADGSIRVFDPTGKPRLTVRPAPALTATDPVFSPDGSVFAAVVGDLDPSINDKLAAVPGIPDVIVWDAHTGAERAQIETPGQSASAVAFTPDGTRLVVTSDQALHVSTPQQPSILSGVGNEESGRVSAFRTTGYGEISHRDFPQHRVGKVVISPDGDLLAVNVDNAVQILRPGDLATVRTFGGELSRLADLAFAPDGHTLAISTTEDNDYTQLWDARTGTVSLPLRDISRDGPLTFLPDGRTLAIGSPNGLVVIWHLDPDDVVRRLCAVAAPQARATGQSVPRLCRPAA